MRVIFLTLIKCGILMAGVVLAGCTVDYSFTDHNQPMLVAKAAKLPNI